MYTISEFSNLFKLSTRTLRHYEEIDLLSPSYRGRNGYRFYGPELIPRLERILFLKDQGFTLAEILKTIDLNFAELELDLASRSSEVDCEIERLLKRKYQLDRALLALDKVSKMKQINEQERLSLLATVEGN